MVPNKAQGDAATTWLVNAAIEAGREEIIGDLVAEVEDKRNQLCGAGSNGRQAAG